MTNIPQNISLLSLPRAGSTSMLTRLTRGMKEHYGNENVVKTGEAISNAGLFGGNHYTIHRAWKYGPENGTAPYLKWSIDQQNNFFIDQVEDNPENEFSNRIKLIRDSEFANHLVIKNLAGANTESVLDFSDALVSAGPRFHHVILWRKDLFGLICSRFVSDRTRRKKNPSSKLNWVHNTAHGTYKWNGKYLGKPDPDNEKSLAIFSDYTRDIMSSYILSAQRLPKDRTVLLETTMVSDVQILRWNDDTILDMSTPLPPRIAAKSKSNKYLNVSTREFIKTADMIHPDVLVKLKKLSDELSSQYRWHELGQVLKLV